MRRTDRFIPQSIRGRLFSLSLLPLALTLLGSLALFMVMTVPRIIDDRQEQLHQTVVAQGEFFLNWVSERFSDLRFLDTLLPHQVDGRRPEAMDSFIASQEEFFSLSLYSRDGSRLDGEPSPYLGDREYFRTAIEGREAYSGLVISRLSGLPLIVFALPRESPGGRVEQVLVGGVPVATLLNAMDSVSRSAAGRTLLVDGEGRVINESVLRPAYAAAALGAQVVQEALWNDETHLLTRTAVEQLKSGATSAGPYENRQGRTVVASFEVLAPDRWYLVGESPVEAVFESLRSYVVAGVLTVLFFLLLFLPILRTISRSIERPIAELANFSREVNREHYDIRALPSLPRQAPREVRALYATFSEMVIRLEEHVSDLQRTAITDPLTGLANRRFLVSEGRRVATLCIDHRRPVSLLMIDIDYFKRINDEFGHDVGDRVITRAAQRIAAATRDTDFVARYGGEEFTVVAPFTGAEDAGRLGERIRNACADASPFDEEHSTAELGSLSITVSVGVATVETAVLRATPTESEAGRLGEEVLEGLLSEADSALYKAKRSGRDRVILAG